MPDAAPTSAVVVRLLDVPDAVGLDALVAEGKRANAFAGSSDPEGGALAWFAKLSPEALAVAVREETVVGVVSPEIKTVQVTPAERGRGIGRALVEETDGTRDRWARPVRPA